MVLVVQELRVQLSPWPAPAEVLLVMRSAEAMFNMSACVGGP
jgi:hypothetical protein